MVSNKVAFTIIVAILSVTIGAYFVLGGATQYGNYNFSTDGSGNYFAKSAMGQIGYSGTNASAIINNAINSLPADGGTIVIEAGTYNFTNTININKSNVVLRGAGASTILNMPNDAFGILVTPSGANLVSNVIIENLNLTGAGVEKSWNTLIMISYAENITVQNCYFTGAGFHSIFAVETDYSLFTKNQISGSNMDAIALAQGSNHNVVSNNFVTNMSNMADMNGIDINGKAKASTFNTVINNTVLWAHVGICFDTASHNIAQGNTISHVVLGIDNTGTGGTTPTTDNWLIGNTISYSEGTGGYSAGIQNSNLADRTTITGNTISFFSDGRCIIVRSDNNTISNNLFQDSTTGIEIHPGGTNNTLLGNTFLNVTTPMLWL